MILRSKTLDLKQSLRQTQKQEFVILDSQFDDVFDKLTNEHLLDKYCVSLGFEAGYISQQLVNCYIPDEQRRSYSLKEYYLWTLTI